MAVKLSRINLAVHFPEHVWKMPQPYINYNGLGVACLRLGRTNAAERAFRSAIELAPQINDNYTDLGNAYLWEPSTRR